MTIASITSPATTTPIISVSLSSEPEPPETFEGPLPVTKLATMFMFGDVALPTALDAVTEILKTAFS